MVVGCEQEGILHFKVSCGHQLITFSDPKHKVDTGNSMQLNPMILQLDGIHQQKDAK
jgi:hypothetical protein